MKKVEGLDQSGNVSRPLYVAFLCLFFFSGAAGLIYEVLWVRQFGFIFGVSTYAVTIVLVAFMFGLGAGAWLIGRVADRCGGTALIRLYAALEIGVGAYALLLPYLLDWMETLYIGFYRLSHPGPYLFNGFKLLLSFLLLIFPTVLLGATLPVLSRFILRSERRMAIGISQLYAVNTFGAITGTVLAGYFLLPALGIRMTNYLAVGISFFTAAAVLLLGFRQCSESSRPAVPEPLKDFGAKPSGIQSPLLNKSILAGLFVSGAAAMIYEVAWTRTLCMILGTTTYAFTTMLSTFLLGIALGSWVYRLIPDTVERVRLFAALQLVTAFFVLLTIPGFEKLPFVYLSLHNLLVTTWGDAQLLRFVLAASVMLVPTLALGVLFPVAGDLLIVRRTHLGGRLGKAYAFNTFGGVVGAAVGGLVLIPFIGMQQTILVGALLNLAAGAGIYFIHPGIPIGRRLRTGFVLGGAVCLSFWLITPWAPRIMNSGTYVYAERYENMRQRYKAAAEQAKDLPEISSWNLWQMAMEQYRLLFYKPGVAATVAVMERDDGVRFLTVNGKTDAGTGMKSDLRTQVMIGQLPLLFHPDPEKVMIVGLGSGITAGSVLTHKVAMVECAEISPAVVQAADFFSEANWDALRDPRLRIEIQDARNMLMTSEERYDVIISQPSNPWVSGEASLFSLEWYRLVRQHLEDGGLFLQWVPSYTMSSRDLKITIHTLRSVMPHVTVWTSGSVGDLVLLAKKGAPLRIDRRKFDTRLKTEPVWRDIARTGLDPSRVPFDLLLLGENELGRFLTPDAGGPPRQNTDDLPVIEYSTPKYLVRGSRVSDFLYPGLTPAESEEVLAFFKQTVAIDTEMLPKSKGSGFM